MGEERLNGHFNPKSYFWVIIALLIILYAKMTVFSEDNPVLLSTSKALSQIFN